MHGNLPLEERTLCLRLRDSGSLTPWMNSRRTSPRFATIWQTAPLTGAPTESLLQEKWPPASASSRHQSFFAAGVSGAFVAGTSFLREGGASWFFSWITRTTQPLATPASSPSIIAKL
jgi:hypothetical protein